jgi:hypothetical protein
MRRIRVARVAADPGGRVAGAKGLITGQAACECYWAVRAEFERLLDWRIG